MDCYPTHYNRDELCASCRQCLAAAPTDPPARPPQFLTRAAYRGPYGNPLIPDPEAMAALTPDALRGFVARTFLAPHMVLAASGVEHGELVRLARPMLEHLPTAQHLPEPKPEYVGEWGRRVAGGVAEG